MLTSSMLLFTSCKKYPEGGFVNQTRKHLFGGNHVGDSKTWKLKLYEVNGIDSTYLIQGASSIPDFYEKFVTFTYSQKGDPSLQYQANTYLYDYQGRFGKTYKQLSLAIKHEPLTKEDSLQCATVFGIRYCSRNLFYPEFNNYAKLWDIKKLTKKECILESTFKLKNSYRIILSE
jgi:hypothetical protein